MKKINALLLTIAVLFICNSVSAHYIWIEAAEKWSVGKAGTIRIYYGEYAEGAREEAGKRLEEANGLSAWIITPDGEKLSLSLKKMNNHFQAEYTPKVAGRFEIELTNLVRDVVDWTQYDIGVVQPVYYGHKSFFVGDNTAGAKPSLRFQIVTAEGKETYAVNEPTNLKLLYDGKDFKGKLMAYAPNTWMKEIESKDGVYTFIPLEKGMYIIESIYKEKKPGTFKDKTYEAIRHRTTVTLLVQ